MKELSLHLLDISENSISAEAKNIIITVEENTITDFLKISIIDDGKGMSQEMVKVVVDPFITSRTTRKVGLGIPLLKAAAEACKGSLTIKSEPGKGTRIDVSFQHSHIDRMPLGDLTSTFLGLVIGSPEVHWIFKYINNDSVFVFDDAQIKPELDGIPLTEPAVIKFIRQYLEQGIKNTITHN